MRKGKGKKRFKRESRKGDLNGSKIRIREEGKREEVLVS